MLGRRNFIVLGFCENPQLPEFLIQVLHESSYTRLDDTKVMVLHFLPFRRFCTKQRAPGVDKVLALFVHGLVHKKIFLLWPDRCDNAVDLCVAKQAQDTKGLLVDGIH